MFGLFNFNNIVVRPGEPAIHVPPPPKPPREAKAKKRWQWNGLECLAHDKSAARAEFKRAKHLRRLPVGAVVTCLG